MIESKHSRNPVARSVNGVRLWPPKPSWVFGSISGAALVASLWIGYRGWDQPIATGSRWPNIKILQAIIIVLWTLLPPLYFWAEFYFYYKPRLTDPSKKPDDFDLFKYGQEVSSKIWLAVISALLAIYFLKDIKL
jgi:hypothetical protein